jgi:hypothetical protein
MSVAKEVDNFVVGSEESGWMAMMWEGKRKMRDRGGRGLNLCRQEKDAVYSQSARSMRREKTATGCVLNGRRGEVEVKVKLRREDVRQEWGSQRTEQ